MGWMRSISVFSGITFFGVILAAIVYELYNQGILVDEFIRGSIVITDVMVVIVVLFMLIAGILAAVTR